MHAVAITSILILVNIAAITNIVFYHGRVLKAFSLDNLFLQCRVLRSAACKVQKHSALNLKTSILTNEVSCGTGTLFAKAREHFNRACGAEFE